MDDLKQNWKSFVGYQEITDTTSLNAFYMYTDRDDGNVNILVQKVDLTNVDLLTEDELLLGLDRILTSFPKTTVGYNKAAYMISTQTYRGRGNTRYKNSVYYNGDKPMDTPIVVAEINGKFAIVQNKNFNKYGFVLNTN
jgi:hypothetical protein